MVVIETEAAFEAAHRQYGDPEKCGFLHGHNWKVEFYIVGEVQNDLGYLVNFSDLKTMVKQYDHTVMLWENDPLAASLEALGQRVFRLPLNPTCENLASIIVKNIWDMTLPNVEEIVVTVWENDHSKATDAWVRE